MQQTEKSPAETATASKPRNISRWWLLVALILPALLAAFEFGYRYFTVFVKGHLNIDLPWFEWCW